MKRTVLFTLLTTLSVCRATQAMVTSTVPDLRLIQAAQAKDLNLVRQLLTAQVDVNAQDGYGYTALHRAAHTNQIAVVLKLIAAGAAINTQSNERTTALGLAILNSNFDVMKALIAAGAELIGNSYYTSNYYSRIYDPIKTRMEQLFIYSRAPFSQDPAHRAQLRALNELVKKYTLRLDVIDTQGNTLLHYAVLADNRVMIGLLLYLMIKYQHSEAIDFHSRTPSITPVEMAVTKGGARLLFPFLYSIKDH